MPGQAYPACEGRCFGRYLFRRKGGRFVTPDFGLSSNGGAPTMNRGATVGPRFIAGLPLRQLRGPFDRENRVTKRPQRSIEFVCQNPTPGGENHEIEVHKSSTGAGCAR